MKEKLIYELKSFVTTFLSVFAVEAFIQLTQIYNGDWTMAVLHALGLAAARSLVKAILQMVYPSQFHDIVK